MKTFSRSFGSILLLAVAAPSILSAQAPAAQPAQPPAAAKPTAPTAKPAASGTPATGARKTPVHRTTAAGSAAATSAAMKLPANIPVVRGIPQTEFALKYIEIAPGTGELAKPAMKYSVHYTGWLHDGTKFDSSVDRGTPIDFIQGAHRVIPGWDEGFDGMKVGGKRRLFIPWQLAYGASGRGPIPPKADLIFDIELVAQVDPNAPPPPAPAAAAPATKPETPQ